MKKLILLFVSLILVSLTLAAVQPGFIDTLRGILGVSTGLYGFGLKNEALNKIVLIWPQENEWAYLSLSKNGQLISDLMSKARNVVADDYPTMSQYVDGLKATGYKYMNNQELQPLGSIVGNLLAWLGIKPFAEAGGAGGGTYVVGRGIAACLKRRVRK